MKWDSKGATKVLKANQCAVCRREREIFVVVTVHGKNDLHFPCCSEVCAFVVAEVASEAYSQ